jgi:plexin A
MSADAGESTNYFHREFRVSDGGTIRRETPDTSSKINDRNPIRSYIAGLTSGTYTYFVASDEHLSVDRVRVIRICDADAWDNWYEVNLYCGETSGGLNTVSNTLIGANFVRLRSGSTALFWTINDDSNVRMCSVLLSDVDSSISSLLSACTGQSPAATIFFPWGPNSGTCGSGATISECDLENSGGPGKLSTNPTATGDRAPISIEDYTMMFSGTPTSVLTFEVDGSIVVFAGFSTGIVNRYVLSSRTGRVTPSVDGSWNITSSVVDLSRANESDYVYALTSSTVYQLPVEECDTFTNCSSCTNSGGGLCGWCTVENKCSRSSACSDSDSAGRWVNDVGQCLVATVTSSPGVPDDYPITTQSISVTLTNLPAAIVGEVFTCEFSGIGTGALTSNGGDSYTCAVPPIVPFPGDGPGQSVPAIPPKYYYNRTAH